MAGQVKKKGRTAPKVLPQPVTGQTGSLLGNATYTPAPRIVPGGPPAPPGNLAGVGGVMDRVNAAVRGGGGGGSTGFQAASTSNPASIAGPGPVTRDFGTTTDQAGNFVGSYQPQTAFGRIIDPGARSTAMNDPDALIDAYFKHRGFAGSSPAYAMALDDSQRAVNLYNLLMNEGIEARGNEGFIDWMGEYQRNQWSPTGMNVGPRDVANAIFNAEPGTMTHAALYGIANAPQTAAQQVQNWIQALSQGLQGSMPDATLQTYMAMVDQAGRDFRGAKLDNPRGPMTFGEYLEQQGLGASRFGV